MKSETLIIKGAVGPIETLYEIPDTVSAQGVVVVCHPHPLFEGTMHNKVAFMLARSFLQEGLIAVRFNFRGVGKSAGEYADGVGEVDDVLAVLSWVKQQWPALPVTLAGFSFGSYVALRTVQSADYISCFAIKNLVTVAPPVGRWDFSVIFAPDLPWLVIQGTDDDLVDAVQVHEWCNGLGIPPNLQMVGGADHFFHGKLTDLRKGVHAWFKGQ